MVIMNHGYLLLGVTIAVIIAGWLGHSVWWPYKACPACKGRSGRGALSSRGSYNRCWRCKGNPELTRVGARLVSQVTGKPVRGAKGKGK